jgi:hypothetical protein
LIAKFIFNRINVTDVKKGEISEIIKNDNRRDSDVRRERMALFRINMDPLISDSLLGRTLDNLFYDYDIDDENSSKKNNPGCNLGILFIFIFMYELIYVYTSMYVYMYMYMYMMYIYINIYKHICVHKYMYIGIRPHLELNELQSINSSHLNREFEATMKLLEADRLAALAVSEAAAEAVRISIASSRGFAPKRQWGKAIKVVTGVVRVQLLVTDRRKLSTVGEDVIEHDLEKNPGENSVFVETKLFKFENEKKDPLTKTGEEKMLGYKNITDVRKSISLLKALSASALSATIAGKNLHPIAENRNTILPEIELENNNNIEIDDSRYVDVNIRTSMIRCDRTCDYYLLINDLSLHQIS